MTTEARRASWRAFYQRNQAKQNAARTARAALATEDQRTRKAATDRARYKRNRNSILAAQKERTAQYPAGYATSKTKAWREANPDRQKLLAKRQNDKRLSTPEGRLAARVRRAVQRMLGGQKSTPTEQLLGWKLAELRPWIERQFTAGMSWSALLRGEIHIDHIVPLSAFTITGPDCPELKRAWALTNLRPLWAKDNLRKNAKREFLL